MSVAQLTGEAFVPDLTLYHIVSSPNSAKVRIALKYKGIDYEKIEVNPMDRAAVLETSGQPLTPVIKHGDTVLFDSGAILRYLEANFRNTLTLFPATIDAIREIEQWELWGRNELSPWVRILFQEAFSQNKSGSAIREAQELYDKSTRHLEVALSDRSLLGGEVITASDVVLAPVVYLGCIEEPHTAILTFFKEHLQLNPELRRVRKWVEMLMGYDT